MKSLSIFEENLVWMSYRYAIGRYTGVSVQHACDLMAYLPGKLDDNRAKFMADDIRQTIKDMLKFKYTNISSSLENYFHDCINNSNNSDETDYKLNYFIHWDELARILDKNCHKRILVDNKEIDCIESYQYNYSTQTYIKVYKALDDLTHHRTNDIINYSEE